MDFMRDLKECQAEVFRRSEQRIKARKKTHKRIFAVCVPLFLVLSLWSVIHVPGRSVDDSAEVETGVIVDEANSIISDCYTVEIQDSQQHYEKITDSSVVFKVNCTMDGFFSKTNEDDFSAITDTIRSLGYSITLTDSEGIRTIYHLTGNLLTNTETNESITLTDEELTKLKTDLGITD